MIEYSLHLSEPLPTRENHPLKPVQVHTALDVCEMTDLARPVRNEVAIGLASNRHEALGSRTDRREYRSIHYYQR